MQEEVIAGIIVTVLSLLILIGIIIYSTVHGKRKKFVKENSIVCKSILELNNNTHFEKVDSSCQHNEFFSTKSQYDRAQLYNIFYNYIFANKEFFKEQVKKIYYNRDTYNAYLENYRTKCIIKEENPLYDTYRYFKEIEKEVLLDLKLKPPTTNIDFYISKKYTSPAGRNSYADRTVYGFVVLINALKNMDEQEKLKETKEYQRSIMTQSLRYDIMKRDGFRCKICGAAASDGVKLHVDHIVPVSKGGKTVPSNLRTLCQNCNLGKSDKYDPYGRN